MNFIITVISLKFWRKIVLKSVLVAFIFVISVSYSWATHLRAGEIIVEKIDCNSLTFKITIRVFTNNKSTVRFGGDDTAILDYGDGSLVFKVPLVENTQRPDLGPDIATASYSVQHTFAGPGTYRISYREPNRNEGVLNMDESVNTEFYVETLILVDPFFGCNSSPQLSVPPIDHGCTGVTWFHNPGAFDPDRSDSLSYELVIPFQDRDITVNNYKDPSDPKFYINYSHGNEAGNGPPSFKINSRDGTLTWDSPGAAGQYNVAFIVREWRKINGEWLKIGFVRRDMQIIVDDCKNKRPQIKVPNDTCVEAGTILKAKIIGTDPENDPVKIEAFSEIFNFAPSQSPATYSPNPPNFDKSNPPYQLDFEWKTTCDHIKQQPYQVVFKITDKSASGSSLVTFKTWFITVVGPAPKWKDATLDVSKRQTHLEWENYTCNKQAETMQIWRRVDKVDFTPDNCQTGMPDIGYTLIATVPVKDANNAAISKYLDTNGNKGLAPGALYCYRLVAVFPLPQGGESYVSRDTCIGPFNIQAPIITNVSVLKTGTTDGQINIKWRKPLPVKFDSIQFPPPYQYKVYRGVGFNGVQAAVPITTINSGSGHLSYLDNNLNTEENVYNYHIAMYANNGVLFVDTSAVASSVRLEAQSQVQKIQLKWSANVPWSNQTEQYPLHDIFRSNEGETEDKFVQIGTVDAYTQGFVFVDQGPLDDNKIYCYKIKTRGAYGNPGIEEPLENLSQIICAQPGDSIPPCKPITPVALNGIDCNEYLSSVSTCANNVFSNTLTWSRPEDPACRSDVSSYNIYSAATSAGEFILLAQNVRDTFYVDNNLASYAKCYRISAVDRSNNESDQSDAICFDNCPYYELPNFFTPNGDEWNEKFSAYSNREIVNETGDPKGPKNELNEKNKAKCARFVQNVVFRVYNRWGKEVYNYEGHIGNEQNTIYIDWDGHDSNGVELSTGVYYYIAEVTFDTADPSKQQKTYKGWIQLAR